MYRDQDSRIKQENQKREKNRIRSALIAKREALCTELNWFPRQLEGAFDGAYRRYRIDGMPGTDPIHFLIGFEDS